MRRTTRTTNARVQSRPTSKTSLNKTTVASEHESVALDIGKMFMDGYLSDVSLVVVGADVTIRAHKQILAARSRKFR